MFDGRKKPYWRERALAAEDRVLELVTDRVLLDIAVEELTAAVEELERRITGPNGLLWLKDYLQAVITKRNQTIRAQKKEITELKGRITVLREWGYDPGAR